MVAGSDEAAEMSYVFKCDRCGVMQKPDVKPALTVAFMAGGKSDMFNPCPTSKTNPVSNELCGSCQDLFGRFMACL
jgi:hypothetical protein